MLIKGNQVIKIKFDNAAVTKAYIIDTHTDALTIRIATGFVYEVQREPLENNTHLVISK